MPARTSTRSSTAKKTDAYVDSSAFIAFLDRSDSYHPLFLQLFARPPRLITTALVITESHGWFLRRYDRGRALQFLAFVSALQPTILAVGSQDIECATQSLRKYADQNLTLVDAHGIWCMKAQRIHTCWSTDRHLALGGVQLVVDDLS